MCNKCWEVGVTLSKRRGMCFDCMKKNKSGERIPKSLKGFSCAEIIDRLKSGVLVKISFKREPKVGLWDIDGGKWRKKK